MDVVRTACSSCLSWVFLHLHYDAVGRRYLVQSIVLDADDYRNPVQVIFTTVDDDDLCFECIEYMYDRIITEDIVYEAFCYRSLAFCRRLLSSIPPFADDTYWLSGVVYYS